MNNVQTGLYYKQVFTMNSHVQTRMYKQKLVVLGINHVYTSTYCFSIHFRVNTCLERVHAMYIQGTQIHMSMQILGGKKLPTLGIEPRIQGIPSRGHNHSANSCDIKYVIIIVFIYSSTWTLVTYILLQTSRPPRPRYDVAWQSLYMPVKLLEWQNILSIFFVLIQRGK